MSRILFRLKSWWFRKRHSVRDLLGEESIAMMASANSAAVAEGANWIHTGHVLIGLARTTTLLQQIGVDGEQLRHDVKASQAKPEDHVKRAIEAAIEEARATGARVVDPLCFLAGMAQIEGTVAQRVLTAHGVSVAKVRALRQCE